jgi:hypothetical protein
VQTNVGVFPRAIKKNDHYNKFNHRIHYSKTRYILFEILVKKRVTSYAIRTEQGLLMLHLLATNHLKLKRNFQSPVIISIHDIPTTQSITGNLQKDAENK